MEATSAVLVTHSGFNSITPANSPADSVRTVSNSGKGELGSSSSLSWDFDEKENESKAAKLKSSGKGSKNFMSPTISTSSKIAQSPKKKILVERNDPVRTSITLSDGKATFFSVNSEEHNQNSENVMEPKETIPVDGLPPKMIENTKMATKTSKTNPSLHKSTSSVEIHREKGLPLKLLLGIELMFSEVLGWVGKDLTESGEGDLLVEEETTIDDYVV
ncbi:hypothetical protein FXO38_29020 [Capsicum annuum]|nr:hypothetical protein FXO38_29020 [Capsicum annuum]KAF3653854.1 hypothetical protein FXO37_16753 [Capsicum annuum]